MADAEDEPRAPLPPAKIEDGKPFPPGPEPYYGRPPHQRSSSGGLYIFLTILVIVGIAVGLVVCAGRGLGSMTSGLGRPLRRRGRPRLARYRRGDGTWHDAVTPQLAGLGPWRRARCATAWLHAARAEHASVPAFEQLASQLAAHAAPPALVARCHDAARDEVRHTRRCYALARGYSGIAWTAGAAPIPSTAPSDLATLAVESLVDGCLGEDLAAELARRSAERARDPVVRDAFAMFAEDEARHAALAWDVVAFCIARDPELRAKLAAAIDAPVRGARGPYELSRREIRAVVHARHAHVRARLATI